MRFNTNYSNLNHDTMERLSMVILRLESYAQNDKPFTHEVVCEWLDDLFDETLTFNNHLAGYSYTFLSSDDLVIEIHEFDDEELKEFRLSVKFSEQNVMFFDYHLDKPESFVREVNTYLKHVNVRKLSKLKR